MKKLKLFALAAMALIGFSGIAIAADATMLSQDDFVGISFWVIDRFLVNFVEIQRHTFF